MQGVTLLAFGNGAPDIISSIAGVGQARPNLVVGELLGAGESFFGCSLCSDKLRENLHAVFAVIEC